jgi:hypothetical protein
VADGLADAVPLDHVTVHQIASPNPAALRAATPAATRAEV